MIRAVRSAVAALGFAACIAAATTAWAQEEENDTVKKVDKTTQQGKITKEDLKGINIQIGKAGIGIDWKAIKSIDYTGAGASNLRQAKGFVDAGSIAEAMQVLEDLRKKSDLRAILKPHVLNLLGSCQLRNGDFDKSIATYEELFKTFPQTQFLVTGGGENLVNAYLGKGNPQGASATLDAVIKAAGDVGSLNLLKARVQEAAGDFAGAAGTYKSVMDTAGDDATKGAAELGIARCLLGQHKNAEAEGKFRGLVTRDLPWLVLAGAWNGIGDIMYAAAADKHDAEMMTDALFCHLRGCVLYVPQSGESTNEYEHALFGAYRCFKGLGEIETKDKEKRNMMTRAKERLELLQTKFPNSTYLRGK
jgi:predicted negative regulator of RcsB-dependent stress response